MSVLPLQKCAAATIYQAEIDDDAGYHQRERRPFRQQSPQSSFDSLSITKSLYIERSWAGELPQVVSNKEITLIREYYIATNR